MIPQLLAVLAQTLMQAGVNKAMSPGGPTGQNPVAQPVQFLDGLVQQQQQQKQQLQPQQFAPLRFDDMTKGGY